VPNDILYILLAHILITTGVYTNVNIEKMTIFKTCHECNIHFTGGHLVFANFKFLSMNNIHMTAVWYSEAIVTERHDLLRGYRSSKNMQNSNKNFV